MHGSEVRQSGEARGSRGCQMRAWWRSGRATTRPHLHSSAGAHPIPGAVWFGRTPGFAAAPGALWSLVTQSAAEAVRFPDANNQGNVCKPPG